MTTRVIAGAVLVGWLLVLAVVLFSPSRVDDGIRDDLRALLEGWRIPGLNYAVVEFLANVALTVPLAAALAVLLGRARWLAAVIVAVGSGVAEWVQATGLPERVGSALDVLANSIGGALGTAVVALIVLHRRARPPEP